MATCTSGRAATRIFKSKYPRVVRALAGITDETVIDGEASRSTIADGRPCALQNYGSSKVPLVYYVFDVLVLGGRNVMSQPLSARRELLRRHVLPTLSGPVRESELLNAKLPDPIKAVREHGFEGIIAKRLDSAYEPGQRSGTWRKMRVNKGKSS